MPPQRLSLSRQRGPQRDSGRERGLQLSESERRKVLPGRDHRGHACRLRLPDAECCNSRCSVLLQDLKGPVLRQPGHERQSLAQPRLRERQLLAATAGGPDALQSLALHGFPVCALRHRPKQRFRAWRLHPCRHQADRLPRERCGGAKPDRPDLRAGNGQFRQVVRPLPDADQFHEDGDRSRVHRAGQQQRPRRLPHDLETRVPECPAFRRDEQVQLVQPALQLHGRGRQAVARCDVAHRPTLLESQCGRRFVDEYVRHFRCHGSRRSGDRRMPGQFSPALHRRLLEQHPRRRRRGQRSHARDR